MIGPMVSQDVPQLPELLGSGLEGVVSRSIDVLAVVLFLCHHDSVMVTGVGQPS